MDNVERLINELEVTLNTIGWRAVVIPTLKTEMLESYDRLGSYTAKPPDSFLTREEYHNFLRGRIDGLKYAQNVFKQQIAEYRLNKAQEIQPVEPVSGSPYAEPTAPTEG